MGKNSHSNASVNMARGHTRVPNLVQDLVMPLLKHSEQAVLHYIVRRTYGFNDASGNPKERDRISLSQFENGIQSGPYVLDLGTGLSRSSIRPALSSLLEKGLVEITYSCHRCLWESKDPVAQEEKGDIVCPRCRVTCDREWSLAPLSSKRLVAFLNANDTKHRVWEFDRDTYRFRVVVDAAEGKEEVGGDAVSLDEYRNRIWFPDLVDRAMQQLIMRGGKEHKLNDSQRVQHFYQPVLELQDLVGSHQFVLRHALEETLRRNIPADVREVKKGDNKFSQQANYTWHRYARAIVQRELSRPALTQSPGDADGGLRRYETHANQLLQRARELNAEGEQEAARALLSELLGQAEQLQGLFDDDSARTDRAIRSAFKYGFTDIVSADRGMQVSPFDYYPEWSPS